MRTVFRVTRYIARYPWLAAGTLAFAIFSTLTVVVFPSVTQRIIDDGIRGHHPEIIGPLTVIAIVTFVLQNLASGLRIVVNNVFEQKVIFDIRSDLYDHIQRLPLSWFDERATGDIMTRVLEDVNAVERVLIDGIEQGTVAVLQILVVGLLLFWKQPALGLLALLPVPLLAAGALAYTLTARKRYAVTRRAASAMNSLLHDNLAGIRQIKAYTQETAGHQRFNQASTALKEATLVVMKSWAMYSPAMELFTSSGLVLVTAFGAWSVLGGHLELGELVASLILVRFLYEPIGRLHALNQMLQSARAAGDRVFEIVDAPIESDLADDPAFDPIGKVEYRHVHFRYAEGQPVLRDVNFLAEPGQTIALVGATGAGKSSLVAVLLRLYDFQGGEIFVDDRPLRSIPRQAIRRVTGFVSQEAFLFNGTIRENLLFAKPDATDAEIEAALKAANADEFVFRLPDRLEARVGERGVKLSVGEKQRISIARAILKDPPLLILDEATASVDNATERQIQRALDRLLLGRTSFVIAHRLSTVQNADLILVLDRGQIVERGTHDELLGIGGVYDKLYRSGQFTSPDESADLVAGPVL